MSHLALEEIEAFLRGEDTVDEPAFRRHVADCPECAARLAEEARLDEFGAAAAATHHDEGEVRPDVRFGRHRHVGTRGRWSIAAAVLVVAVIAVVTRPAPDRTGRPAATPSETARNTRGADSNAIAPRELLAQTPTPSDEEFTAY